jgi:hypothetical protein
MAFFSLFPHNVAKYPHFQPNNFELKKGEKDKHPAPPYKSPTPLALPLPRHGLFQTHLPPIINPSLPSYIATGCSQEFPIENSPQS